MIKATLLDSMGSDITVVNAARVSFSQASVEEVRVAPSLDVPLLLKTYWREYPTDDNYSTLSRLSERDAKLVKYLAEHRHMSPFGHCFASFHVTAPIFVARQLVKHKFLRWNEVSRRYVDSEPTFYTPTEWRGKASDKKQGSSGVVNYSFDSTYNQACLNKYKDLLASGVAPEQARLVLPLSTMTEWYWSGSLDAFADMCKLRLASDTQQETTQVAEDISKEMGRLYPYSWKYLMEYNK